MSTTLGKSTGRRPAGRWRTVDLVTSAVLGVAFGVVFWGWHFAYSALDPLFALFPPVAGLVSGVWLLPAVVGALVVRRPGAALLTELVAASVEALLGTQWSAGVLVSGAVQGLGVEIAVALFLWRRWTLAVAVLAGAVAAAAESVYEWSAYWAAWSWDWKLVYAGFFVVSGVLVAGLGGWALVRALARAGALSAFAAGHEHRTRG
ncbi:ECF transporter S component [Kineococcus sp. SYSU DK018]|uniref:ECF transporter S component n=1 Tax=Kineococcus sp. SYSU DK018 TaxID=3383139 RepID=UPI003D7CE04C